MLGKKIQRVLKLLEFLSSMSVVSPVSQFSFIQTLSLYLSLSQAFSVKVTPQLNSHKNAKWAT